MKREQKYKNTDTFTFYNRNPKNRITGDCSFRAISTALDRDYKKVVMDLAQMQCNLGYAPNDTKGEDAYLVTINKWVKHKQPRDNNNKKITLGEFCKILEDAQINYGNIVCHAGSGHTTCIMQETVKGKYKYHVVDIWDCSKEKIGNWYSARS